LTPDLTVTVQKVEFSFLLFTMPSVGKFDWGLSAKKKSLTSGSLKTFLSDYNYRRHDLKVINHKKKIV
jgi:hypothetical protein